MITKSVPTTLAGQTAKVTAEIKWDPRVPVQVTATFTTHEGSVEWVFALELLRLGAASVFPHQVGYGDVQITSDSDSVVVFLSSVEGQASVSLDYSAIREFLDAVCLANLHEAEAMAALVDEFLSVLNEEAF